MLSEDILFPYPLTSLAVYTSSADGFIKAYNVFLEIYLSTFSFTHTLMKEIGIFTLNVWYNGVIPR